MGLFTFIKKILEKISGKYGSLKFVFRKNYGLSYNTEKRAVEEHNKLVSQFIKKNGRKPIELELKGIIRKTSHVLVGYKPWKTGHWPRQKIRQYLFNLHGIGYTPR